MRRFKTQGYDILAEYSENELIEMYLKQGMTLKKARKMAKVVSEGLHKLRVNEVNSWNRIRRLEKKGG